MKEEGDDYSDLNRDINQFEDKLDDLNEDQVTFDQDIPYNNQLSPDRKEQKSPFKNDNEVSFSINIKPQGGTAKAVTQIKQQKGR